MSGQGNANVTDRFYCPFQTTEGFTFDVCHACKMLDVYMGEKTTIRCRANKGIREKRSFESAFLLNRLGWPWRVEIIKEKHDGSAANQSFRGQRICHSEPPTP